MAGAEQNASPRSQIRLEHQTTPEGEPWGPPAASIAALRFTFRSADAENQWFVDGIHDQPLIDLSGDRVPTVISRASAMAYTDTLQWIDAIADSEEVAAAMDTYLKRNMRYWGFDGLVLDPAFDRHRDHTALPALEPKYARKQSEALQDAHRDG